MISAESFINSLQDKTIIELDESTKLIENTIKTSFASIQEQLVEQIKNNVRDQLIKKIGSSDDLTDKQFQSSLKINNIEYKPSLKPDEYIIGGYQFKRYHANNYHDNNKTYIYDIIYTNYNTVHRHCNSTLYTYKSQKTIKLSNQ